MTTHTHHTQNSSAQDSDQKTITVSKSVMMTALASPIAYYAAFAKAVGDVCAGVFVSQLFYWHDKGADPDGWIYKTREEIYAETGLSRRNQQTARKRLVGLGVLEEERRGMPATMHFRLNLDRLFDLVEADSVPPPPQDNGKVETKADAPTEAPTGEKSPVGTNRTNKKARTVPTDGANRTNKKVRFVPTSRREPYQQPLYTKNTTEITTEITNNNDAASQQDGVSIDTSPQLLLLSGTLLGGSLEAEEKTVPSLKLPLMENEITDKQSDSHSQNHQPVIENFEVSDLSSLCEAHEVELTTARAALDLYSRCTGETLDAGGTQALLLWLATYGEAVLRESIGALQTALLTRKIETDPLRYLGGIVKHKAKEAADEQVESEREGRSRYYEAIPEEYRWVVIG